MKRKATRNPVRKNRKTASKAPKRRSRQSAGTRARKRAPVRRRRRVSARDRRPRAAGRRGIVPYSLEILDDDLKFQGVCNVTVPSIYGTKGQPLPKRMAKMVHAAAQALQRVFRDVVALGGHLYITDMFRSAVDQQRAHEDWKTGRKTAYSPPSCSSVHEAGRAIDIDAFDTGIGHERVRQILNKHGWVNIVKSLTGPECWHYEFREEAWESYKAKYDYAAMARAMKAEIGNLVGAAQADKKKEEIRQLQFALNTILGCRLTADGRYGEDTKAAIRQFQQKYGLQVDGVAGPITLKTIAQVLEKSKQPRRRRALSRGARVRRRRSSRGKRRETTRSPARARRKAEGT